MLDEARLDILAQAFFEEVLDPWVTTHLSAPLRVEEYDRVVIQAVINYLAAILVHDTPKDQLYPWLHALAKAIPDYLARCVTDRQQDAG